MRAFISRFLIAIAMFTYCATYSFAQNNKKPISDRELLAMIAGNVLSENIVHEIETRGLNFVPNDQFRSLVSEAGADSRVIAGLSNAKPGSVTAPTTKEGNERLLQHLAKAGKLIRNKGYGEATRELGTALLSGGGSETGFVMGEVLRGQEEWLAAEALLVEVKSRSPDFPGIDTKLSFILYRIGDYERALSEARIALSANLNDAEAHKNEGLALHVLERYAASEQEFQAALRLKPDYAVVRFDFGLLFYDEGKYDQAIAEYKKAIALNFPDSDIHYYLGLSFEGKGELDSAIREYREAVKMEPSMYMFRDRLGHALMSRAMYPDAVKVFRDMETLWPNNPGCHDCIGTALFTMNNMDGAEKEFHEALALDPTDAFAHEGLGRIRQEQKNDDAALKEYRQAQELNPTASEPYFSAGSILFARKDYSGAIKEFKQIEYLTPSDPRVHDLMGQSLSSLGDSVGSIAEFKQAVALDPKRFSARVELAAALEAQGDWVPALEEYRQAAQTSIPYPGTVVEVQAISYAGAQAAYQAAQNRFHQHVASLKASGKVAEAAVLERSIGGPKESKKLSTDLDAVILKGSQAASAGRFEEIEKDYKEAVALAEKVQPRDDRLKFCLIHLANFYAGRKEFDLAEASFQRAIKVTEDLHGQGSPELDQPLQEFGHYYLTRHDYSSGFEYYSRAVAIDEKVYGENSNKVADSLRKLSFVYLAQKDYAKAEPYLLRAQSIIDSLAGPEGDGENLVLSSLCNLYENWDKPEKGEPRNRQMLAILEKQYGPQSPVIVSVLITEAKMLRELGRQQEAAKFEQRALSIRSATGITESGSTAQLPK
jgi:tetratricopeptide (TPR) repeat protein